MFKLELLWDRPAHTGPDPSSHVIRVRIIPQGNSQSLPLRMAVALDTSTSMQGEKLSQAKQACRSVAAMIRAEDRLSLAGYATRVNQLCAAVDGGAASSRCNSSIESLRAEGVTRTDLALDWIAQVLPVENGTARVGILITDGHATNLRGEILSDVSPVIGKASSLSDSGITLCSVGLGDAAGFNTSFLTDLADKGRGEFIFAQTPAELEPLLRNRFAASQAIGVDNANLVIKPLKAGVRIKNCCRFRPTYAPLDTPLPGSPGEILVGALRADVPTDMLVEVEVPPLQFGESNGSHNVLEVQLNARAVSPVETAAINYTASYIEAQSVNTEVDQDRVNRDVAVYSDELNRTSDPNKTANLLQNIQHAAQKSGQLHLADQARKQLEELKKKGKVNPNLSTDLLNRSRNSGGAS